MILKKFLLLTLLTLWSIFANAQDPLLNQFKLYQKSKAYANLFVHFDKNVYSSNETVYLTGYIVRSNDYNKHQIMSVSLINDYNNKIILEDRFVMRSGFSFGSIVLPDSIQPGNYRFQAITDYQINGKPEVSFTQPILIKSLLEPALRANMKILQTTNDSYKVLVAATTADNRFLAKPADITYFYGKTKHTIKTDNSGQAIISIPKTNFNDPNLYVTLKYDGDSTNINLHIPQIKSTPIVKFYPEGGNLISGLRNSIAWEIKDKQRNPIAVKAEILKDGKTLESINSNNQGFGRFDLSLEEGAQYSLKVISDQYTDTIFSLPKALDNGLALHIKKAVVRDTLEINVKPKNDGGEYGVRIHNFKNSFIYTKFQFSKETPTVKIPLNNIPPGLLALTITDQEERPLAERIFFAHHDGRETVDIKTDKPSYGTREKVNMNLDLKNIDENAVVSIAIVQDERINENMAPDIVSYTYLNNELADMPLKLGLYKNEKQLEQLLLTKAWRRYTWQDLKSVKPTDTVQKINNLTLTGTITKSNKPLTSTLTIGAMGSQGIKILSTDNSGNFNFNDQQLFSETGRRMFMFINNSSNPAYKFKVNNQLLETSQKLASASFLDIESEITPSMPSNESLFVKAAEKTTRLKEVGITTRKSTRRGQRGTNECGDYVCTFGILNCRNHYGDPNNYQPDPGVTYKNQNGQKVTYPGCNTGGSNLLTRVDDGIHLQKEFYLDDYKDPKEPAYFSTIYWNYAEVLNKGKSKSISFHTSDITGKYRVIIQGITQNKQVFGQYYFDVKKK